MKITTIIRPALGLFGTTLTAALPANPDDTGNSYLLAPFTSTPDQQILCQDPQMADTHANYAEAADCKALADIWRGRPGYWDATEWTSVAGEIAAVRTCHVRVSRRDGGTGHVWIGNGDVSNFIDQSKSLSHDEQMGFLGSMTCWHNGGSVEVLISVME